MNQLSRVDWYTSLVGDKIRSSKVRKQMFPRLISSAKSQQLITYNPTVGRGEWWKMPRVKENMN